MPKRGSEMRDLTTTTLRRLGVTDYEFGLTRGGHQKVIIRIDGHTIPVYFPSTPSDNRSLMNHRSFLIRTVLATLAKRTQTPCPAA